MADRQSGTRAHIEMITIDHRQALHLVKAMPDNPE
jgi:hypothetical protein